MTEVGHMHICARICMCDHLKIIVTARKSMQACQHTNSNNSIQRAWIPEPCTEAQPSQVGAHVRTMPKVEATLRTSSLSSRTDHAKLAHTQLQEHMKSWTRARV